MEVIDLKKWLDRKHGARSHPEGQKELSLLLAVATAVNQSSTIEDAMQSALDHVCTYARWPVGHVYLTSRDLKELLSTTVWHLEDPGRFETFRKVTELTPLSVGVGLSGRVLASGEPVWVRDVTKETAFPQAQYARDVGIKASLAFPILLGTEVVGVLEFFSEKALEPDDKLLALMAPISALLGRAIERQREQEKFQQNETYYRFLTENALELITTLNRDGTIRYESPYVELILGYEREDYLGKNAFDFVHPDDVGRVMEAFIECLQKPGNTPTLSFRFRRKDGSWRVLEGLGKNLLDDPAVAGIIFNSRDITERKQAEDALRESEMRHRSVVQSAQAAIISADSGGKIISWNRSAQVIFGYEENEALGKPLTLLIPERYRDDHVREIGRFWSTGESRVIGRTVEVDGLRKDGTEFPLELALSTWESDKKTFFSGIILDISERRRAEEQIQRQRKRLEILHETNLSVTSTLDLHTILNFLVEKTDHLVPYPTAITVRLFNPKTRKLEPVACRNLHEEEWKAGEWQDGHGLPNMVFENKIPLAIRNLQRDTRTRDPEFFRRHGLVSYLGIPLMAKGEILGVLGFYSKGEYDFTNEETNFLYTIGGQTAIAIHNAQLYEEIKMQAADLDASNKVKSEFLGVMSHELRTPLSVILGYASMINSKVLGEINPRHEEALRKIERHSNQLLDMISSIMEATKIESKAAVVEIEELILEKLFRDLKSTYGIPLHKELAFIWDYPYDDPVIRTDSGKLRQILQNLINNAVKFTDKGTVKISARRRPEKKAIEFKVADTGIGIAKAKLPIIFEIFRQIDSSQTRSYGGVGLGLYIVKQFTQLLGGEIEVASEPGKGSTFTVTIPYTT